LGDCEELGDFRVWFFEGEVVELEELFLGEAERLRSLPLLVFDCFADEADDERRNSVVKMSGSLDCSVYIFSIRLNFKNNN
jgi:hypothetical protein